MDRAEELIQKYLDDLATGDELAELQSLLVAQPAVADRFAAATRHESLLAQRVRQSHGVVDVRKMIATPPPRRRRWVLAGVAAVAVLLAIGLGVVLVNRPHSTGQVVAGRIVVNGADVRQLPVGVRMQAAGESDAVLRLPDGSRVELAPASLARLLGADGVRRESVELLDGRGRFDVAPGPRHFVVDTPAGNVTVLGTTFSVDVQTPEQVRRLRLKVTPDWKTTVRVAHGKVRVEQDGIATELTDGQSKTLVKENPPDLVGFVQRIAKNDQPRFYVRIVSSKLGPGDVMRRVLLHDDQILVGMDAVEVGETVMIWTDDKDLDRAYLIARAKDR